MELIGILETGSAHLTSQLQCSWNAVAGHKSLSTFGSFFKELPHPGNAGDVLHAEQLGPHLCRSYNNFRAVIRCVGASPLVYDGCCLNSLIMVAIVRCG